MNENCIDALSVLYGSDEPMTTTEVAREVFDVGEDGDERIKNAERKVRYYFTDAYPHLVDRVGNGSEGDRFTIVEEAVWLGIGRVEMEPVGEEKEVSVGLGPVFVYVAEDGSPQVVNIGAGADVQNRVSDGDL